MEPWQRAFESPGMGRDEVDDRLADDEGALGDRRAVTGTAVVVLSRSAPGWPT